MRKHIIILVEEDTQKINYLESEKVKLDKSRSDLLKLVGIFSIEEIRNRTKDIDTTLKEVNSKLLELKNTSNSYNKNDIIDIEKIFKEFITNYESDNRMQLKKLWG